MDWLQPFQDLERTLQGQTGFLYHYTFVMLAGVTFFIALIGLWDVIESFVDARLLFIFLVVVFFSISVLDKNQTSK